MAAAFAEIHIVAPFFAVAGLAYLSACLIWFYLPERTAPSQRVSKRQEERATLKWTDRRALPWVAISVILSFAQAIVMQLCAFYFMDVLNLKGDQAMQMVSVGLMAMAMATLFAQIGLIQRFNLSVEFLLRWGSVIMIFSFAGLVIGNSYGVFVTALTLAGLGFGLMRPGLQAGASLSVSRRDQGAMAGFISGTSATGLILNPFIGIPLYHVMQQAPFILGALLTGLYSHQTGLVLTQGGNVDDLRGPGLIGPEATPEATPVDTGEPPYPALDPRFPTWGTMLREQGYETWWWGKWHLDDASCDMEQFGFSGGTCPSPNGGPGGGMAEDPNIAGQAVAWLEAHADRGPWCTTVSFVNPHDIQWYPRWTRDLPGQNDPPSVFSDLPPNFETAEELARQHKPRLQQAALMGLTQVFGAMPHRGPDFERHWLQMLDLYHQLHGYLDREIGRLLDALEARPEVAANTIIVFTSDHGEYCGSHGLRGKGAGAYEEGIRVPLWITDPTGRFAAQPERVRSQLTSSVDIAPMLLTLACGNDAWRQQPDYAHLARRHDLTSLLQDTAAPGRAYAVHTTDEDGYEYGPVLFPFLQDAPFHVVALVTDDAKIGLYTDWADDSDEILADGQEFEFYDYTPKAGRLELANTAGEDNHVSRALSIAHDRGGAERAAGAPAGTIGGRAAGNDGSDRGADRPRPRGGATLIWSADPGWLWNTDSHGNTPAHEFRIGSRPSDMKSDGDRGVVAQPSRGNAPRG